MLVEIQFAGVCLVIKWETGLLSKDSDRRVGELLSKLDQLPPE